MLGNGSEITVASGHGHWTIADQTLPMSNVKRILALSF